MKRSISLFLCALCVAAAIRFNAHGQSRELTTEQLTSRAEVIAVGTVSSLESAWNPARTRISTQVTVAVSSYLKGARTEQTFTVTVPGGEVDGQGESYSHVARFRTNEQVVVFAEGDGRGGYRVTGGEQGKLTIREDPATRMQVVSEGLSLDVLKGRIRNVVNALEHR